MDTQSPVRPQVSPVYAPPVPRVPGPIQLALRRLLASPGFSRADQQPAAPLPILQRLFREGEIVQADDAARALAPVRVEALVGCGLLEHHSGGVRALFQLKLEQGLLIIADFFSMEHAQDFVLPVGRAGRYLARLTIRRPVASALDLGCGCGIQSLLAAAHAGKVTATDVNPRALALTRLNADLNGISNVEVVQGSYFEPIRDGRFDLILANLPYVITPEARFLYRDVDQPGDASIRRWIREIPAHLDENGFAHVLVNWVHGSHQAWWQPVEATVAGLGVDAWLVYNGSKEPGEYADLWIDSAIGRDTLEFARTKQAWVDWYDKRGIGRIALGALTLRRRSAGDNWFRKAYSGRTLEHPAGEQFLRLFAMQDYLQVLGSPRGLLKEVLHPQALDLDMQKCSSLSSAGLSFEADIDPAAAATIGYLDGRTSLDAAIRTAAQELKEPYRRVERRVLNDIQSLVQLGMIIPGQLRSE